MEKFFITLFCLLMGITSVCYAQNHSYKYTYRMIRLDSTYDAKLDPALVKYVERQKKRLDKKMSEVIGRCDVTMNVESPESPLSDFLTGLMLKEGPVAIAQPECDLSIMNFGGIRSNIQSGDVTVGDIFKVSPFDNYLVVVTLKGSELRKAVNRFRLDSLKAACAGMQVSYKDNVPYRILVQNKELQDKENYRLITLNFIAEGGDDILSGLNFELIEYTDVLFRDFLIDEIKKMTKEGKSVSDALTK